MELNLKDQTKFTFNAGLSLTHFPPFLDGCILKKFGGIKFSNQCKNILFQILTKDSVTVFVNAIMYYKVANAIHAVANVDDYSGSARLLAATTLRFVFH